MMGTRKSLSAGLVVIVVSFNFIGCGGSQQQVCEPESVTVHTYLVDGLTVQTGDLICTTTTRGRPVFAGLFYRAYGIMIPGPVDHIVVYVGPGGRCVEAGAKFRVLTFSIVGSTWDASRMAKVRGPLYDSFYGVAYPLAGRSFSCEEEASIRRGVASYCLRQAQARKPYNVVFADSMTDDAFYCSQLAYKAYLDQGIDLNTGEGAPDIPGTDSIVYPQEIWAGCKHEKPRGPSSGADERIP